MNGKVKSVLPDWLTPHFSAAPGTSSQGERGSRKHGSEHNEPPQKSEAARTPVGQQHISEVWKLRLRLIKAQHLPKKHFNSGHVSSALMGTPDPFVTFEIPGQQQQKSKAITNSLNPVWNEEFVFDVHDEKQELVLKVFDLHEVTKNDLVGDLIGEVRLKLSELSSFLNTKSSTRTFNIMNATPGHAQQGRPVIGNDSETATVTLLLSASNKESAHGLGDEEADLYYVQQQEALLLKQHELLRAQEELLLQEQHLILNTAPQQAQAQHVLLNAPQADYQNVLKDAERGKRQAAEGEASVEQAGIKGLPSSAVQAMHNEVIIENLRALASVRESLVAVAELAPGGVRPNPLLPLRKKKEEDAWEEPVDALGQIDLNALKTLRTREGMAEMARTLKKESELLEQLAMQGDVRGVGHIRSVMAESSFTRDVHDSQHVLLGLEASDMRMEERRREKVPNTFMLIHRVKEIQPPPKMPHNLQMLVKRVEEEEPERKGAFGGGSGGKEVTRKHLVMCELRGSKLHFWKTAAPVSTREGEDEEAGIAPHLRKHFFSATPPGTVYRGCIELTPASSVQADSNDFEIKIFVVNLSADKKDAVTQKYTFLQVPDHIYPRRLLADIADILRTEIERMQKAAEAQICVLRKEVPNVLPQGLFAPLSQTHYYNRVTQAPVSVAFKNEGAGIHLNAIETAEGGQAAGEKILDEPDRQCHVRLPPGYEDAPLLDGYIPHFLATDSGRLPWMQALQPETIKGATHFEKRKHQLWTALQTLKNTAPGTLQSKAIVEDLLVRTGSHECLAPASVPLPPTAPASVPLPASAVSLPRSFPLMKAPPPLPVAARCTSPEPPQEVLLGRLVVETAKDTELDYARYRRTGVSAQVWDVEYTAGILALRHVPSGMTLLASSKRPDVAFALVSAAAGGAGGEEYFFSERSGLEERELSAEERAAMLSFTSRFLAALQDPGKAQRARDTGAWDVWHNWEKTTCYGFWTVGLRSSTRCVAENAGDAGGGCLHLLPNGFVLLGREKALLHLLAEEGPVGPVLTSAPKALKVFADEEEERVDAPHNLVAWRPCAQAIPSGSPQDIARLRQEKILVGIGLHMQPVNLTVNGRPPFEWAVHPELMGGLELRVVDDFSAQIVGVPSHVMIDEVFTVGASNQLGSASTTLIITSLHLPSAFFYHTSVLSLTPGSPTSFRVASLEGSGPFNFKCDKRLPEGLRLDRHSGLISGIMAHDDLDFPAGAEMVVHIIAANAVGTCAFELLLTHGKRQVPLWQPAAGSKEKEEKPVDPRITLKSKNKSVGAKAKQEELLAAPGGADLAARRARAAAADVGGDPALLLPPDEQQVELD